MSLDIEMLKQINSQGKTNEEGEITGGTKRKKKQPKRKQRRKVH